MKQYVTVEEYLDMGGKNPTIDARALERMMQLATIKVDEMTFRKIRSLDQLTVFQRELVKQATIAQTNYLLDQERDFGLDAGPVGSWSITDVSISMGGDNVSAEVAYRRECLHSPLAQAYLDQSGLTWRGV